MLFQKQNQAFKKRKYAYRLISWIVLATLFLSLSVLPSWARNTPADIQVIDRQSEQPITEPVKPVPVAPSAPGLNDPQEFEAFIDNFFKEEMSKSHIPGGVVSVVKDGKIFFAKGYGYANVEKKIPVEADKTLFRVASLSKLFTATAAMQLYERGLLQLNGEVNNYLTNFQLENPYPEPVKVAQLMTHTDGTSQRRIGLAARTAEEMQPLGDYLADQMPPVVWFPGKLYNYSSHSSALLGYFVQKISGLPVSQYIDKNIFQPLNMPRSTFVQPPPPPLTEDLAVGYQYQNGNFKSVPYLYLNIAPAASMQTTAIDMAHFAIAHLQLGRYENARILEPDTVRLMHQTHFTQHPLLPGTAYEFHERLENGIRSLTHLGSLRGYSSSLTLLPDRNIGIFTATNSFAGIHGKLLSQFFDRYFPVAQPRTPKQPISLTQEQLNRFTGIYRDLEYPRDTFAKMSAPFKHIKIEKADNGTLQVRTPSLFFLGNAPKIRLIPVEPLLFQRVNDEAFTGFGEDSSGRIAFAFNPLWPVIGTFERIHWYERVWVQLGVVGFCAVVFLSAALIYPIAPLIRHLRGKRFQGRQLRWAWILAGLSGTLNLVFLIGFPVSIWLYGFWRLVYGVPTVTIAFLCIPLLTTALTLGLFVFTALAWKNQYWSFVKRSHYSLITLAALVFIPFLAYWNLLGFQF